jgi:hypothetical protein
VRVVIEGKTVYRDAYYDKYKLATELDGKLAHQERWRDNHRDNQAGAHGILTTRYGWRDVYGHPGETALLQARIVRKRGWTGRPPAVLASLPRAAGVTRRSTCGVCADRVNHYGRLRVSPNEARRKRDAEPRLMPGNPEALATPDALRCDIID